MGDNEVHLATPSKGSSDATNILKEFIPECDEELKPIIGKVFDTVAEGGLFYKKYAHEAGFSVRSGTERKDKNGETRWKYFLCSKQGFKEETKKPIDEMIVDEKKLPKTRQRKLTREGCNARIIFKRTEEGKYAIDQFHEGHSHALATPRKKQFLRSARNVNNVHKNLLLCYSKANVGPSKVYQLLKEQVGSYDNIGCKKRDLQNYSRDLKQGQISDYVLI